MPQALDTLSAVRGKLKDFLPRRVFDAHAHVYDASFMRSYADKPEHIFGWPHLTADEFFTGERDCLYGVEPAGALLLPTPDPLLSDRSNGLRDRTVEHMRAQLESRPEAFGAMYVLPGDTEEDVERMIVHERVRGFKCYYYSSPHGNQGPADEFLPESAWAVANRRGMTITLHLATYGAMSDPRNLSYLEAMTEKYPNARLILAHAGRSFAAWTGIGPMRRLAGRKNVFYDLSAICESAPIEACIRFAGIDHVMWGSDYPCCLFVGRPVSFADRFVWFDEAAARSCGMQGEVFNVQEENLLAMYIACDLLDLDAASVEQIFYGNAHRLIAEGIL